MRSLFIYIYVCVKMSVIYLHIYIYICVCACLWDIYIYTYIYIVCMYMLRSFLHIHMFVHVIYIYNTYRCQETWQEKDWSRSEELNWLIAVCPLFQETPKVQFQVVFTCLYQTWFRNFPAPCLPSIRFSRSGTIYSDVFSSVFLCFLDMSWTFWKAEISMSGGAWLKI